MTTALITGATAGIGAAFARRLAADGHDLVLVARDTPRLDDLAREVQDRHGVAAEVLTADLSVRADTDRVAARLADAASPVAVLVNNAGFGVNHGFLHSDLAAEQQMLDVMVTAPLRLCHAALPGMVERDSGSVINVSSIAGWIAGGTYSAAKAWVTVFTEGLAVQLRGTGVTAIAVCPGFTRTEFHERADMDMSGVPPRLWLSPQDVVDRALADARRGRTVSVAGRQYQVLSLLAQYAPRPLVRRLRR
jgi:short-subunit dehydrogenase